jgi:hypothetical protein
VALLEDRDLADGPRIERACPQQSAGVVFEAALSSPTLGPQRAIVLAVRMSFRHPVRHSYRLHSHAEVMLVL